MPDTYIGSVMVSPFIPAELPIRYGLASPQLEMWGECKNIFGQYVGKMNILPNPAVLVHPMAMNEATLSSRIEGTRTQLDEALDNAADVDSGEIKKSIENQDNLEVRNYYETLAGMAETIKRTGEPITLRLIRDSHKHLLDSVRGADKNPGRFRMVQNWIGSPGKEIEDATFVPPDPTAVPAAMDNWIDYAQNGKDDIFIRLAILHAQFELIHPFDDGNGRLGRMLIPLMLYSQGHLDWPLFYLSEYLEKYRDEYYASLLGISRDNDWRQWVHFFLGAVYQQGLRYCRQIDQIAVLYDEYKLRIPQLTHSQHAIGIIDFIFANPRFTISFLARKLNMERMTAYSLVNKLCAEGLIEKVVEGRGRAPSRYQFSKLLNDIILSKWTIPKEN